MTENDPWGLASAVAERICHDLAGLTGTLGSAVEMAVEDSGRGPSEALDIAVTAAGELAARLRLLRAAFGSNPGALDGAAILALAAGLTGAGRVSVTTGGLSGVMDGVYARIVLLLVVAAGDALGRGGAISVSGTPGAVGVAAMGPGVVWPDRRVGVSAALAEVLAAAAGLRLETAGTAVMVLR